MTTKMTTEETVKVLSTMTNRDHAGRHFTERYSEAVLNELETAGLIEIRRPIHQATGLPYSEEYYHLHVTEDGRELVEANEEYWDTENHG